MRRRRVLKARQQRHALLVHRIETPRKHRLEQIFLAAEVVVDSGEVDPGGSGHLAQRSRLEPMLHKELFGASNGMTRPPIGCSSQRFSAGARACSPADANLS